MVSPSSRPLQQATDSALEVDAKGRNHTQEASPENREPLGSEAAGTPPSTHFLPPARPGGYPGHGWITARSGSDVEKARYPLLHLQLFTE